MVTIEKILQIMNSWHWAELIAVCRKKCLGTSSRPIAHAKAVIAKISRKYRPSVSGHKVEYIISGRHNSEHMSGRMVQHLTDIKTFYSSQIPRCSVLLCNMCRRKLWSFGPERSLEPAPLCMYIILCIVPPYREWGHHQWFKSVQRTKVVNKIHCWTFNSPKDCQNAFLIATHSKNSLSFISSRFTLSTLDGKHWECILTNPPALELAKWWGAFVLQTL